MTTKEITNALIAAQIAISFGKPMTAAETAEAVRAIKVIGALPGAERVAIHEAVVKGARLCAAA